jgi:tape measure domain-containing protein
MKLSEWRIKVSQVGGSVVDKLQKSADRVSRSFDKAQSMADKFTGRNRKLGNSIGGLKAQIAGFEEKKEAAFSIREIIKFNTKIAVTNKKLQRLQNQPPASFFSRLSRVKSALGGIAAVALTAFSVGAIGGFIQDTGMAAGKMEQLEVSFTTLTGSGAKAVKVMDDLRQFSNVTPFEPEPVYKAGKALTAFGVENENLIPTLTRIGDIAAGTGKDFNELTTIYGKAKIAGTLYAEDINQLVEAGIPIMDQFADILGVGVDQVKKMASEGKLKFSALQEAFGNLTGEGGKFYHLMESQSKTFLGRLSTMNGKWDDMKIKIGTALMPLFEKLMTVADGFLDGMPAKIESFTNGVSWLIENGGLIIDTISALTYGAGAMAIAWGVLNFQTIMATATMWALNLAFLANPIFWIALGIGAFVTAIVLAYKRVGWFRGAILGTWEVLKGFGNIIKDFVIDRIKGMLSGIMGLGSALIKLFKGDLKGAISDSGQAVKDLTGAQAIQNAYNGAKGLGSKFQQGYSEGQSGASTAGGKKKSLAEQLTPESMLGGSTGTEGAGTEGSDTSTSAGATSVAGGGSQTRNVTVHFTVKEINLTAQSVGQNLEDMADEIMEKLIQSVRGAELALANE